MSSVDPIAPVHWLRRLVSIAPLRLLVQCAVLMGIYSAMATGALAVFAHSSHLWRALWLGLVLVVIVTVLLISYRRLAIWIERRRAAELPVLPDIRLLAAGTLTGVLCLSAMKRHG